MKEKETGSAIASPPYTEATNTAISTSTRSKGSRRFGVIAASEVLALRIGDPDGHSTKEAPEREQSEGRGGDEADRVNPDYRQAGD